jgi:hypothetical protein
VILVIWMIIALVSLTTLFVPALCPNDNRLNCDCRLSYMQTTLNGRVHPRLLNSDLLFVLFMCFIFRKGKVFLVKQFSLHIFVWKEMLKCEFLIKNKWDWPAIALVFLCYVICIRWWLIWTRCNSAIICSPSKTSNNFYRLY